MSSDVRGDPSSALLEVLDPEQNESFNDHYLDLDYDLSKVLFICTANSLHGIPIPLQDRLEIIRLPGYTEPEKLSIAKRYLIPKQREANGLTEEQLTISKEACETVIRRYTKEAGVRNLERELAAISRKVAKRVVDKGQDTRIKITSKNVEKLLGVPKFRYGKVGETDETGFVNGLAWTSAGGVMVPIEAVSVHGTGKTTLTGQLGDVFQEILSGRDHLHPKPLGAPGSQARLLPRAGPPRSCARALGGRWTFRRHHHCHSSGLGCHRHRGTQRNRDDRLETPFEKRCVRSAV